MKALVIVEHNNKSIKLLLFQQLQLHLKFVTPSTH